jgi:hypothetical protein
MYKNSSIAVLLVAFGLVAARSTGLPASNPTSPVIVVKRRLVNQTAPIPTTTIFTPAHDGVYRLSVYATITKADPSSQSWWYYTLAWTDDAGPENPSANPIFNGNGASLGQFSNSFIGWPMGGSSTTIEAKAGTPITYTMGQSGGPDNSAYSLYYVLEQVE